MTFKIFALFALTLFALTAVASASLSITAVSVPSSTNPSTDIVFTFTLNGSDSTAYTSLVWNESTTNVGSWKILPTLASINANETRSLSAVLTVPTGAQGTINAVIKVKNDTTTAQLPVNVPINNVPSLSVTKTKELTKTQTGLFTVTNNGNTILNNINVSSSGSLSLIFSETSFSLAPGSSKNIDVSSLSLNNLTFGSTSSTVTVKDNSQTAAQASTSFSISNSFCKNGSIGGKLILDGVDISSTGDDDTDWMPLDTITVEVQVQNDGNDDVKDINVQLGLYDSSGKNKVGDLDFVNTDEETINLRTIKDGDDDTATFEFKVPADMNTGNYKLSIKAYSDKTGENSECIDYSSELDSNTYQEVSVNEQDDEGMFIAFDNIELNPTEATCGDTVAMRLDVFNVGTDEQDQVRITLTNKELGISLSQEIRNNMQQGDKESISFLFTVPQNLATKTYKLALDSEYDYKNGVYRQDSDDSTEVQLKAIGCGSTSPTQRVASISASLDSEAKAGKEMTVTSKITNIGSNSTTFIIDVSGYEDWAELKDVSDRLVTLNAGQSKEVTLTFTVNSDAAGEQDFKITATSGNNSEERTVSVDVAKSSIFSGMSLGGSNSLIWIIAIINIVLILLIIIVAIRIARR